MFPFSPAFFSFLVIMFIIPAAASGANCAEGLLITSILSILLALKEANVFALALPFVVKEGLPSMRISTLVLPLKDTLPSQSTSTEGIFCISSLAEPEEEEISAPTLKIFLSIEEE